jgi:hypothetical protein
LGGKNVFFQGSTNGTVLKGVGLLIVFQRFGLDKLDISWFHFRNWISFVADTKMRKTTSEAKIFRPTIVFTRRKSKIPDERCEDYKTISPFSNFMCEAAHFPFALCFPKQGIFLSRFASRSKAFSFLVICIDKLKKRRRTTPSE